MTTTGVLSVGSFNEGKSLVHAVGHWLGLMHTYHGAVGVDHCDASNIGDYVQDTPQQAIANTLNCQVEKSEPQSTTVPESSAYSYGRSRPHLGWTYCVGLEDTLQFICQG